MVELVADSRDPVRATRAIPTPRPFCCRPCLEPDPRPSRWTSPDADGCERASETQEWPGTVCDHLYRATAVDRHWRQPLGRRGQRRPTIEPAESSRRRHRPTGRRRHDFPGFSTQRGHRGRHRDRGRGCPRRFRWFGRRPADPDRPRVGGGTGGIRRNPAGGSAAAREPVGRDIRCARNRGRPLRRFDRMGRPPGRAIFGS